MKNTVGLFFGSFNPIHIGHLIIASHMVEYGGMEKVWFVVSPENPLKDKTLLLDRFDRLDMVNLAIEKDERFASSDIEFRLPRPSYTIHTLASLQEKHPLTNFFLIMGSDNLESIEKWKNYEELLSNYNVLVYPRPGYEAANYANHPRVQWVEAPLMQISASYIRQCIRMQKDVRYLLPSPVSRFIEKKGFYL
jgi:nicotinate-nucleotide adenylyltransferase